VLIGCIHLEEGGFSFLPFVRASPLTRRNHQNIGVCALAHRKYRQWYELRERTIASCAFWAVDAVLILITNTGRMKPISGGLLSWGRLFDTSKRILSSAHHSSYHYPKRSAPSKQNYVMELEAGSGMFFSARNYPRAVIGLNNRRVTRRVTSLFSAHLERDADTAIMSAPNSRGHL